MKLNFPKIVHEIDMAEYDEAMAGQKIQVWVNPPGKDLVEIGRLSKIVFDEKAKKDEKEKAEEDFLVLFAKLLSQKEPVSADDLRNLRETSQETDPAFWNWFQTRIVNEIVEHRLRLKKD